MKTLSDVLKKRCPFIANTDGTFMYCIAFECMAFRKDDLGNYYCVRLKENR